MNDEDVARAWRQHADETPPAGVDAAILAAAHRAVGSGPSTIRRAAPRWWVPMAAAATVGAIALGVLQLAPRDDDAFAPTPARNAGRAPLAPFDPAPPAPPERTLSKLSDQAPSAPPVAPAPRHAMATAKPNPATTLAPAQPMTAQPSAPPSGAGKQTTREPLMQGALTKNEGAITAPPAPASSGGFVPDAPATAADAGATMAQRMPESLRADNAQRLQAPAEIPRESGAIGNATREMANAPMSATVKSYASSPQRKTNLRSFEAFTTHIALLRKEGNDAAAAAELRAFRMAYPDADRRLPPELREWAATIKP